MRNAFLVTGLLLLVSPLAVSPLAACSSDKSNPSEGTGGTGGEEDGGGKSGTGGGGVKPDADGNCPDGLVNNYQGTCLEKAEATAMCRQNSVDQSPPGTKVDDLSCGAGCTCEYCAAEMFQCSTDPDCVKILLCAQAHNCNGANCYTPDTCMAEIDGAGDGMGLTSQAVAIVQFVNACATKTPTGSSDYSMREGGTCMSGCK